MRASFHFREVTLRCGAADPPAGVMRDFSYSSHGDRGVPEERRPSVVALGDATRLRLLRRQSTEGPLSITRLSEGTGVTRQAITRHRYSLDAAGLVRHARQGREQIWDLNAKRLEIARQYLDHERSLRVPWR